MLEFFSLSMHVHVLTHNPLLCYIDSLEMINSWSKDEHVEDRQLPAIVGRMLIDLKQLHKRR